jgi:hypothetical protein
LTMVWMLVMVISFTAAMQYWPPGSSDINQFTRKKFKREMHCSIVFWILQPTCRTIVIKWGHYIFNLSTKMYLEDEDCQLWVFIADSQLTNLWTYLFMYFCDISLTVHYRTYAYITCLTGNKLGIKPWRSIKSLITVCYFQREHNYML